MYDHVAPAAPLDMSFLKIKNVECKFNLTSNLLHSELKKEKQRGGVRKPYKEDDDEEDSKMKTSETIKADDPSRDDTEGVKAHQENVIRAVQTQQISKILAEHNV